MSNDLGHLGIEFDFDAADDDVRSGLFGLAFKGGEPMRRGPFVVVYVIADLTKNDGENLREMIRYAKKSKSKQVKKDLETICSHPAIKPLVPH